jgi:isoleucyl-tRNA synthetase
LEYPDNHVSKSIYVAFEVVQPSDTLKEYHSDDSPVKVAVWTTTPWTMPANLAVAINPELSYSVVTHKSTGKLVVATDLIKTIEVSVKQSGVSYYRILNIASLILTWQPMYFYCYFLYRKSLICLKANHLRFSLPSKVPN